MGSGQRRVVRKVQSNLPLNGCYYPLNLMMPVENGFRGIRRLHSWSSLRNRLCPSGLRLPGKPPQPFIRARTQASAKSGELTLRARMSCLLSSLILTRPSRMAYSRRRLESWAKSSSQFGRMIRFLTIKVLSWPTVRRRSKRSGYYPWQRRRYAFRGRRSRTPRGYRQSRVRVRRRQRRFDGI